MKQVDQLIRDEGAPPTLPSLGRDYLASGVVRHRAHWVDLILEQGASANLNPAVDFEKIARDLIAGIRKKEIEILNEKIDGAPAIVFGFDSDDRPFVVYKLDIGRKSGPPRLIHSREDCAKYFDLDNPVGQILAEAIEQLAPAMQRYGRRDLTFQADLLFTPVSGEKREDPLTQSLHFKPNRHGIEYILPQGSKFQPYAAEAKVGLVVHTVGVRQIGEEGKLEINPSSETLEIEALLKAIRSPELFAIDPWSRKVRIDQNMQLGFTQDKATRAEELLSSIRDKSSSLSREFQAEWKRLLPHLKIFFNSSLKDGGTGGIYKAAQADEPFDFQRILDKFQGWVDARSIKAGPTPKWVARKFEHLRTASHGEFSALCEAYFDAIRLQYLLKPHMQEVYSSKLGGGRIEGVILQSGETVVKLVDRLDFTMLNFQGDEERRRIRKLNNRAKDYEPVDQRKKFASLETLPAPFNSWHPGAVFVILKAQPPHTGHIALINEVVAKAGDAPVYVIASAKSPIVRSAHWKRFGATDTKRELNDQDYTYILDKNLRKEILRAGVEKAAKIHFIEPQAFWAYVSRAKKEEASGQVYLAMGEKEADEGRYDKQLEKYRSHLCPIVVKMQKEGISGTMVREAIKAVAQSGDFHSEQLLDRAFEFIPADRRNDVIERVIQAWKKVDAHASRFRKTSSNENLN